MFFKTKESIAKVYFFFPYKKKELSTAIQKNIKNIYIINKIVHFEVRLRLTKFLRKNKNKKAVVLDIPLLLEGKINDRNDIIVFVDANKKEINKRLKKRYNFKSKIYKKLKKLQLPLEKKKKKSNFIIKNNFKSLSLEKNVKLLKKKILSNERSSS